MSGPTSDDVLLRVDGLSTHFTTGEGVVRAVEGVDLTLERGRTRCVVGESGCGKSVTARSILGLIDPPGKIVDGTIGWHGGPEVVDLARLDPDGEQIRRIRGADISMIFQEPMAALSPLYTVGAQLVEAMQLHLPLSKQDATDKAVAELRRVGIPQPEQRMHAYPFQLSGGMNQRVMIAMALSCEPALLIADEPTTALDVTTQARILDLLAELQAETGMAMMFITHDLGVVAEIADDVTVMYLGTAVEEGSVTDIFDRPKHPYTQALLESIPAVFSPTTHAVADANGHRSQPGQRGRLAAISGMVPHPLHRPAGCPFHTRCKHVIAGICDQTPPDLHAFDGDQAASCHLYDDSITSSDPAAADPTDVGTAAEASGTAGPLTLAAPGRTRPPLATDATSLLDVRDLTVHFPIKRGILSRTVGHIRAVDGVDLAIRPGETLGLVGESGCGKTTLGRTIVRALTPTAGQLTFQSATDGNVDLAQLSMTQLRQYRDQIRMIFQDPFSSLNPRMTLLQLVAEPLRNPALRGSRRITSDVEQRVGDLLVRVGLRPEYMRRYPHAFSGGERQRVNIARALITNPRLVIADEAVSALDVSVRAQILNLLADLQDEFDLTYLFISHDLSVIEHLCDRVAVMYLGKIVETAPTAELFSTPHHPYTEALMSAVPVPDPHIRGSDGRIRLADDLPDPANPPSGCPFHTRCPHVRADSCASVLPDLRSTAPSGDSASHLAACHYTEELDLRGVSAHRPTIGKGASS